MIVGLFVGLVQDIVASDQIVAVDTLFANLLYAFRNTELVHIFLGITLLGTTRIVIIFALVISFVWWLRNQKQYILPLWLTIAGNQLFVSISKISMHRIRPDGLVPVYNEASFSFPSGHAAIAVVFYGFITYFLCRNLMAWKTKINILFVGLVMILAIGFSRLYLGVHFLSDVLSGYLVGMIWLIIGISIVEWRKSRTPVGERESSTRKVKLISFVLLVGALVFYIFSMLTYRPALNLPSSHTTQIVVVEKNNFVGLFETRNLPKFTETLSGKPQEPLSFIIIARDDNKLVEVFCKAGWQRADPVTFFSLFNIVKAALMKTGDSTGPMTPSFWNNQVHDFGFEKPTSTNLVSQRHHARFWKTNLQITDGKSIYVGTASFDIGIKWFVTHKIQPDIDTERERLLTDLRSANGVADFHQEQFVGPTLGKNFSGDEFFTDGKIYIIDVR